MHCTYSSGAFHRGCFSGAKIWRAAADRQLARTSLPLASPPQPASAGAAAPLAHLQPRGQI
jgi:hypothetical protein